MTSTGTLTLNLVGLGSTTCKLKDEETVENPIGGGAGVDELTLFSLTGCKGKFGGCPSSVQTVVMSGGAWETELFGPAPIRDRIVGLEMEVKCANGSLIETYEGELTPEVGASVLSFRAGSGELENPISLKRLKVSGTDKLKGPAGGTKISAEEVEREPHWYSNGKRIAEGTPETVATHDTLTYHASNSVTLTCAVTDTEIVENPIGGLAGVDELTAYSATCKQALVFGAGSGTLSGSNSTTATVSGTDTLKGPTGDTKITAEDP